MWGKLDDKLYVPCIKTKMDLTYKMKIGSTVTKKQYASPGGQPRNGEGMYRREKGWSPRPILSLIKEK